MLKDKLAYYPGNARLKVGAANGSGFFYIGTVKDFLDNIDKYSERTLKALNISAENTLNSFIAMSRCFPAPDEYFKWGEETPLGTILDDIKRTESRFDWHGSNNSAMQYFKNLSLYIKKTSEHRRRAQTAEARVKQFVPFASRDVEDIFIASSVVEPEETLVFMIEGFEFGDYWSSDEVKGNRKLAVRIDAGGLAKDDESEETEP